MGIHKMAHFRGRLRHRPETGLDGSGQRQSLPLRFSVAWHHDVGGLSDPRT